MTRTAAVFLLALPLANAAYVGAYVAARATHRLVRYDGFIARPNAVSGIGWSPYEIAFAPLVRIEGLVRRGGRTRRRPTPARPTRPQRELRRA